MPDYPKGNTYNIWNSIDDEVYIGSTVEPLCKRMWKHTYSSTLSTNQRIYKHMNTYGFGNFHIELVENCPCGSVGALKAKEWEWIRKLGTLNHTIASRTWATYYQDNQAQLKDKSKQWYTDNYEQASTSRKQWYDNNKDKMSDYSKQYKERNKEHIAELGKQYRKKNKDNITHTFKQWREKNKERRHLKHIETTICECGATVTICNLKQTASIAK